MHVVLLKLCLKVLVCFTCYSTGNIAVLNIRAAFLPRRAMAQLEN